MMKYLIVSAEKRRLLPYSDRKPAPADYR